MKGVWLEYLLLQLEKAIYKLNHGNAAGETGKKGTSGLIDGDSNTFI